jgi:hypothetical protein
MPVPGKSSGLRQRDPSELRIGRVLAAALRLAAVVLLAPPVRAQEAGEQAGADVVVTGQRPGPACAARDLACLNRQLTAGLTAGLKTSGHPPAPRAAAAIEAQATTPSKAGTFSHAATAQRMGGNLGKSAQPYRPRAPIFSSGVRTAPAATPPITSGAPR